MRVSTLRAVDRWIGVPGCGFLTLYRLVFRRSEPIATIRRILFVKLAEQGSTVLAAGALLRAIEQVGRENVFFLAFQENRFILDAMELVPAGNVLTLDVDSLPSAARSVWRVVARLRALHIDAAIDLEFFARASAILTFLSGARVRVGLHSFAGEGPWRGDLMTHRLVCNPYLHTSDLFLVMVEALAHPADRFPACSMPRPEARLLPPARRISHADVEMMRRMVGECTRGAAEPPLILLNANTGDLLPLRRWDTGRYVELARRLLAALPEIHVLLTGGPGERHDVEALAAAVASPRCVSVAGKTTLPQLLALYSLSRVLVTNDSGPAHFAALTSIEVVTLFGPETPALFAARTPRNHVLWAGTVCSPCVSAFNNRVSRCRDNICMQRISVDEVFEATLAAYLARVSGGDTVVAEPDQG
ncbi:MAG: glycosyltransferase family 9 protein [Acidobacteria bacterium]|nr:glycosyltransferase family 9 protein [Acidobacteriota bacterium]